MGLERGGWPWSARERRAVGALVLAAALIALAVAGGTVLSGVEDRSFTGGWDRVGEVASAPGDRGDLVRARLLAEGYATSSASAGDSGSLGDFLASYMASGTAAPAIPSDRYWVSQTYSVSPPIGLGDGLYSVAIRYPDSYVRGPRGTVTRIGTSTVVITVRRGSPTSMSVVSVDRPGRHVLYDPADPGGSLR